MNDTIDSGPPTNGPSSGITHDARPTIAMISAARPSPFFGSGGAWTYIGGGTALPYAYAGAGIGDCGNGCPE